MPTLEEVLVKPLEELTEEDKAVIKESAEKLTDEQKEKYKDVLGSSPATPPAEPPPNPDEPYPGK